MKRAFFVIAACLAFSTANAQISASVTATANAQLPVHATTSVQAQLSVRDSLETILHKSAQDDQTRYRNAHNFLSAVAIPAQETEIAVQEVLCPFVEVHWRDDKQRRHTNLSALWQLVAFAYREHGGENRNEKERLYMEKALEQALLSGDDMLCAKCYNNSAYVEIKRGDVAKAHEYLYRAIEYFDRLRRFDKSSEMLYTIACNFISMKDVKGLQRVSEQMREYLTKDNSKQSLYQYNSIKHHYFGLLEEQSVRQDGRVDFALVDSAMVYIRANIALVENSLPELAKNWVHGYAYYYLAKELDTWYPERNAEILEALGKARKITERDLVTEGSTIALESNMMQEFDIMLNSILARTLFRTGRLQRSHAVLDHTLALLAELDDHENLNTIRSTVYRFAVEYYKKTDSPAEALRFASLLTANEERIHEWNKTLVINEMSAKYDAERNRTRIEMLTRENRATRQIMWLIAGLSLALMVAGGLIILWGQLRRKNIEQQLYETALVAELSPLMPVRETIEKIVRLVAASTIEKDAKTAYLARLERLDIALLENVYRCSGGSLTSLDMKYIVCFAAEIAVRDIGLMFNVEPASVNTVRYRIRKKFAPDDPFRLVI